MVAYAAGEYSTDSRCSYCRESCVRGAVVNVEKEGERFCWTKASVLWSMRVAVEATKQKNNTHT